MPKNSSKFDFRPSCNLYAPERKSAASAGFGDVEKFCIRKYPQIQISAILADSDSVPKNLCMHQKTAQNMLSEPSYNFYAPGAQIRAHRRILKILCGFGFFTQEYTYVQKISSNYIYNTYAQDALIRAHRLILKFFCRFGFTTQESNITKNQLKISFLR